MRKDFRILVIGIVLGCLSPLALTVLPKSREAPSSVGDAPGCGTRAATRAFHEIGRTVQGDRVDGVGEITLEATKARPRRWVGRILIVVDVTLTRRGGQPHKEANAYAENFTLVAQDGAVYRATSVYVFTPVSALPTADQDLHEWLCKPEVALPADGSRSCVLAFEIPPEVRVTGGVIGYASELLGAPAVRSPSFVVEP